jgi:exonuclease III
MRIISWNMGCAPRGSRYRRTHATAWRYLLDTLTPDIAFVQEALRPTQAVTPNDGELQWSADIGNQSGTAVFIRRGFAFEPLTVRSDKSYVAGARVSVAGEPIVFISVHVGPSNYRKNLKTLVDALCPVIEGTRFVVGGDWNAARHVDDVYGGQWYRKFFDDLAARQMVDCHWTQHGEEVPSLWRKQDAHRYQCDHIFADAITASGADCNVMPHVETFSDLSQSSWSSQAWAPPSLRSREHLDRSVVER